MRSIRSSTALAGAAFALLLGSGGAFAGDMDVPSPPPTGSVGDALIRDSSLDTAATCRYDSDVAPRLNRISVGAPMVYWPDTDSDNDFQHGKVSHVIIVQRSNNGGAAWSRYRTSTVQTAIAYEGSPAPLTKRLVSVSVAGTTPIFRVLSRIRWHNNDGTVRGTLKHWYSYARWTGEAFGGVVVHVPCLNKVTN